MDKFKERTSLQDIKSSYVIKDILLFLKQKEKLNLIFYNKQLQNLLRVDIQNYKKLSGKYKIVEKNGKGKEYVLNTNNLIFEGEYIDGKRNGKGKEYDYGIMAN